MDKDSLTLEQMPISSLFDLLGEPVMVTLIDGSETLGNIFTIDPLNFTLILFHFENQGFKNFVDRRYKRKSS